MATPTAMHAAIATWQFQRAPESSAAVEGADDDRVRRFLRSIARSRLPVYRDYGIVFALAMPIGADSFTTVTVYASVEGLTEGVAKLPVTGEMHGEIYDQVVPIRARLGPMTDVYHLSQQSALRTLERRSRRGSGEREDPRIMRVSTWQIRDEGITWPDGTQPQSIPVSERCQRFLRIVKKWMASRQATDGLTNRWVIDTGAGTITFLAIFVDAESAAAGWADFTGESRGDLQLTDYIELIEEMSGPVIDLMRLGNDPDEAPDDNGDGE
jgi:hypothetical protein